MDPNATNLTAVLTFLTLVVKLVFDFLEKRRRVQDVKTITTKIDENTDISRNAFDVANHVNEKIAAVHQVNSGSNEEVIAKLDKVIELLSATKANGD